jgi:hypothetical protein
MAATKSHEDTRNAIPSGARECFELNEQIVGEEQWARDLVIVL